MLDRLYLPFLGLVAAAAIALALVWPQGLGDRSPAPFGHTPIQQTPEMQEAMRRETEAAVRRVEQAREAVREAQAQAAAPSAPEPPPPPVPAPEAAPPAVPPQ